MAMGSAKRPAKLADVLAAVRAAVDSGNFLDTVHANQRQQQRSITRPEYLYVLKYGYHEKAKDTYEDLYGAWKYAIRGKTVDKRDLRVIVTFEDGMLIITVMEVGK